MGLIIDPNRCIDKKTFKNMRKREKEYIGTPDFVYLNPKTKKEWINLSQFSDMEKRWNIWKKEKGIEANCVHVGTPLNAPTSQTGNIYVNKYLTDYNIKQDTSYYCALNVIQNIWYTLFNQIIEEKTIANIAGTVYPDGTDHLGINKALNYLADKYTKKINIEWKYFSEIGWEGIKNIYKSNNKAIGFHILYRNKQGHYESGYFINTNTQTIGIINSLGNKDKNGNYVGYFEKRTFTDMLSYINGINQPTCLIVTKND